MKVGLMDVDKLIDELPTFVTVNHYRAVIGKDHS
jgi:hypothetical protein